jgi:hypothetical protein
MVCIDEIQDIHTDSVPVIEECLSHSAFKFKLYAGTPKSLDNTIESLWAEDSTQNEWVVPCDMCGGGDLRYWNILSEANIGKEGLICDRCGSPLNAMHDEAQWASMNPNPRVPNPMEGYRIPQIMVPWVEWDDILSKQLMYTRAKFYNECLGLSYDSGTRPLTRQDILDNCVDEYRLTPQGITESMKRCQSTQNFMGIDWGTGEQTYTLVVVCAYTGGKFQIVYCRRFEGAESEPLIQLEKIYELVKRWRPELIGCDYGGGFDRNDALIRKFGPTRVFKYQYSTITSGKVKWDAGLTRFLLNRTEVMSDVFNAIKRRTIFGFPKWEDFDQPYAADMLNIFSEFSSPTRISLSANLRSLLMPTALQASLSNRSRSSDHATTSENVRSLDLHVEVTADRTARTCSVSSATDDCLEDSAISSIATRASRTACLRVSVSTRL